MTSPEELAAFAEELRVEINERLGREPEMLSGDMFVRVISERLIEDGAVEDLEVCYERQESRPQIEISGYNISADGTILDLVAREPEKAAATVAKARVQVLFRRAVAFADACRQGQHKKKEESSPQYDMMQQINENWEGLEKVRILLLTDGRVATEHFDDTDVAGLPVTLHVWDITRLHRLATSGREQEEIVIDLLEMGHVVPILESPMQADEYRCLLAVLPGRLLADLYERHHSRILQRNVRAYLQARPAVNRGIHATIRSEPGRFLAYNNGISATATRVETEVRDGTLVLRVLHDLQIVNGGQTTASLHQAGQRNSLDDVHVMAKITEVAAERLNELVPQISRYANSQNIIRLADFEANGQFHVGLERVSRTTWAPQRSDEQRDTKWYYERVRGQYQVERSRQGTPARRKRFEQEFPSRQRFGKTDVAKYEMAYLRRPDLVSLGAEKCFNRWTVEYKPDDKETPTPADFKQLVAKGILFQGIRDAVLKMRLGGYPGQIAAYVMSVIIDRMGDGLDLETVWRQQRVPEHVAAVVPEVTQQVRQVITNPPGSANVTEWCKKGECWNAVRDITWAPPASLGAD